jgi:hypothetical protein
MKDQYNKNEQSMTQNPTKAMCKLHTTQAQPFQPKFLEIQVQECHQTWPPER